MSAATREGPGGRGGDRILVIDDDEIMLLSCSEILTRAGHAVETFASGEEGIRRIREAPAPLLFVDLKMPKIDGMEVIRQVREIDPSMVIVVITGYATIATAVDAMKAGAYDFLPKPFTPEELMLIVRRGVERWHLAREFERLRQEKEQVQRRFVTFVSHQLKTPLSAVKQYMDVMMYTCRSELPERAQEWVRRSQVRLAEMLALIKDWLDLSRLEHGQLVCCEAATDLHEVTRQVVQSEGVLAEKSGVSVRIEGPAGLPLVRGDAACLGMLMSNLVSNAVKYNRPGGQVTVEMAPRPGGVEIRVRDTGIGIPKEGLEQLFEEFYRVKGPSTQEIPGTGLGLAICKRIVTELGGSISVTSEEGKGSTFTVFLPTAAEGASGQSAAAGRS